MSPTAPGPRTTRLTTIAGLVSPAIYIAADVIAASRYPGFSYTDQAVSELFAIGAPTHPFVVVAFSISSALLLGFALGMWRMVAGKRRQRVVAAMLAASAVNALVLWNAFPMHMRGEALTFTDTMHVVLAANPFWLLSLVFAALGFRGWFRSYSIAMIVVLLALAAYGFSYAPAVVANGPTPWMGLAERTAQYLDEIWQGVLALVLWREHREDAVTQLA